MGWKPALCHHTAEAMTLTGVESVKNEGQSVAEPREGRVVERCTGDSAELGDPSDDGGVGFEHEERGCRRVGASRRGQMRVQGGCG